MISNSDIVRYHEQGWLVVEGIIDRPTLAEMHRIIEKLVSKASGKSTHDEVYDLEPTHTPENPRVRRIKKPHVIDPIFWDILKSGKMLSVLKKLLGPGVRLHGSKLNMKSPRYGAPVEWHQDWAFYSHTNDDILAIGVMLDDVFMENGPLLVLPGSHRGVVHDHHFDGRFCGAIDPARSPLDFKSAIPVLGKAGSCSFHHVRLVHGSAQNTSDLSRNLLLYECAAADAWPLVNWTNLDEFNSRMICGEPTIEPRLAAVPVRIPFPPAVKPGSIYENQSAMGSRYFGVADTST